MARGSYLGGSTLIGAGRTWTGRTGFEWTPVGKTARKASPPSQLDPRVPKIVVAGERVSKKTLQTHRAAQKLAAGRDAILAALGRPLPKLGKGRSLALKKLVDDALLLQTGAINIHHPAVAAWLKSNGKKTIPNG